jgi:HEAT repeat protein
MPADSRTSELTVADLVERLHDPDELVRLHAALALGSRGEEARAAVPALLGLLGDGGARDRRAAAWALRDLAEAAEEAVPALLAALEDEDDGVVALADQALEAIQGAEAAEEDDETEDDLRGRRAA